MNEKCKRELLRIARQTLNAVIRGERAPEPEADAPELRAKVGAFVTLKKGGRLRGCVGVFTSEEPLAETVARMTEASATEDPRFILTPILPDEVDDVGIEISVLSELQKLDDPLDFELGVHGIYVTSGRQSGCFLPQVAIETGWSKEEFLSQCCAGKAGLDRDAWRRADTEVCVFTAEIIKEQPRSKK